MGLEIGTLFVRRSAFINASPARVWEEFLTLEKLQAWFGTGHELHQLQPVVGSPVDISIPNDYGAKVGDDGRIHFIGTVLVAETERELSFQTRWHLNDLPGPSFWTLRLTALYEGTQVEIIQSGIELMGAEMSESLEGLEEGWDNHHLKLLRSIIES